MRRKFLFITLTLGLLGPICARATMVDPTSIPDGTYTVKVEQVIDAKHLQVLMTNGSEARLTAGRPTVDFSKVQANDQLKLSLIKGAVAVYMDLTSH